MRIGILSDIHANLKALEAVLADSLACNVESYWSLGDAIGYGPEPVEPLMFIKGYVDAEAWVLGNHEAILAGLLSAEEQKSVNEIAQHSIRIHQIDLEHHADANQFWKTQFRAERIGPRVITRSGIDHLLVHGSQSGPPLTRYIYSWQKEIYLSTEFRLLREQSETSGRPRVQWYGHTHVPTLVTAGIHGDDTIMPVPVTPGLTVELESKLYLINPGSVGQPRDTDNRASYAILDSEAGTVTFRRVVYDWQETAQNLNAYCSRDDLVQQIGKEKLSELIDSLVWRLREAPVVRETPKEWGDHYARAREME